MVARQARLLGLNNIDDDTIREIADNIAGSPTTYIRDPYGFVLGEDMIQSTQERILADLRLLQNSGSQSSSSQGAVGNNQTPPERLSPFDFAEKAANDERERLKNEREQRENEAKLAQRQQEETNRRVRGVQESGKDILGQLNEMRSLGGSNNEDGEGAEGTPSQTSITGTPEANTAIRVIPEANTPPAAEGEDVGVVQGEGITTYEVPVAEDMPSDVGDAEAAQREGEEDQTPVVPSTKDQTSIYNENSNHYAGGGQGMYIQMIPDAYDDTLNGGNPYAAV